MKILIVEDDPLVAADIRRKLEQLQYKVAGIEESYAGAMQAINNDFPDLVLIDIELSGPQSGIDLGKRLSELAIPHIYITGQQDPTTFRLASQTSPLRNLPKPVGLLHLRNTLLEIDLARAPVMPVIRMVRINGHNERIEPGNITYVEADSPCCHVFFTDRKRITLTMNMGDFIDQIEWPNLVRIGKSNAINLDHLGDVIGNEVKMKTGERLRITEKYRDHLFRRLRIISR